MSITELSIPLLVENEFRKSHVCFDYLLSSLFLVKICLDCGVIVPTSETEADVLMQNAEKVLDLP